MVHKNKRYSTFICGILFGVAVGYCIPNFNKSTKENSLEVNINVTKDGVIYDTIHIKHLVATNINNKKEKLPLNEQNLKKVLKDHGIKHPNIVLAQAKLETGNFKSKVCKTKGNLFGLRKGNRYRSYSHWTESVIAYKKLIQSRYKGGDYFAFLNRIGYASDPTYLEKLKNLL